MRHWDAIFRSVNTTGTSVGVLMKDCGNTAVLISTLMENFGVFYVYYTPFVLSKWKNKAGDNINFIYIVEWEMNLPEYPLQHEMINDKTHFLMRNKNVMTSPKYIAEQAEKQFLPSILISNASLLFFRNEECIFFSLS